MLSRRHVLPLPEKNLSGPVRNALGAKPIRSWLSCLSFGKLYVVIEEDVCSHGLDLIDCEKPPRAEEGH